MQSLAKKSFPITPSPTAPAADVLLVPGGAVENSMKNAALLNWVQKNAQTSKHVMSVCTGALILAKAGLLDGLTATAVSHAIDGLGEISPKIKVVRDQRYVDNGKIITTAGLSSGIDGAFHVIEKIKGRVKRRRLLWGWNIAGTLTPNSRGRRWPTLIFRTSMESMLRLFPLKATLSIGKLKCFFPSLLPRARFWNCSAKKLWPKRRGRAVR